MIELHVGKPNVGNLDKFITRIKDIFERRWFSNNGPYAQEFEAKLSEYLGVKHCLLVCNATIGLDIAFKALGLKGEVLVPSFTFIATTHSLYWQGIKPIFCDIDPKTHNLDAEKVEAAITPDTTGIVGVHVWGRQCNIDKLTKIAKKHHLKLIFDAAHAFGCSHKNQMIGSFGDAEVFSFHATKFFNTFEGGCITTNNTELAAKIKLMRNFGFAGLDNTVLPGTNGKMTEISAAMGLTSLESIDTFVKKNRENYWKYQEHFRIMPGFTMIEYDENEKQNFQYIVVEIDESIVGCQSDEIVNYLHENKIFARRYFFPGCHQLAPYKSLYPEAKSTLYETEKVCSRVMVLPTGMQVSFDDIDTIVKKIKHFVQNKTKAPQI
jgi:dTDP-4-amino-4,6-dideoxygalactose transaminase